jgi:hypothetical protein
MTKTNHDDLQLYGRDPRASRRLARLLRRACLAPAIMLIGAAAAGGCDEGTTSTVAYSYEDPYLYSYYYPADLAYTGYYAADSWNYGLYYAAPGAVPGSAGAATVINNSGRPSLGTALRAVIRGESVCPGQVTVTPKTAPPACSGSPLTSVKNGITVVFNGCQLSGGGKLDGTFDVQATKTASAAVCASDTMITLNYTTTATNLVYTSPEGARISIPSQTDTGNASYTFGQNGTSTSINSTGEAQFFNTGGTMIADLGYGGMRTLTFSTANQTYTVDGTVNLQDKMTSGASATLAGSGIERSNGCCRPTAGTLTVTRVGGQAPGQHVWAFQSTCGTAKLDGSTVTLPACE